MQEAKQGCLLGCAGLATLLVVAAAGLLIYVATHREEWGRAAAAETRAQVEAGTRHHFPEGVSTESIERLGEAVERGLLTGSPSKENLERLLEASARVENPETTNAETWAGYLLVLTETLYEGRLPPEKISDLRERVEAEEFKNRDAQFIQEWMEELAEAAG